MNYLLRNILILYMPDILLRLFIEILMIHVNLLLCCILTVHPIIDFLLFIIIDVFFILNKHKCYLFLYQYKAPFNDLTYWIIDNITRVKLWFIPITNIYICFLLLIIKVNNTILMSYCIGHTIVYIIIYFKYNVVFIYRSVCKHTYFFKKMVGVSVSVKVKRKRIIITKQASANLLRKRNTRFII